MTHRTRPGSRYPPGAKVFPDGVNFSIFSQNASSVELHLYEREESVEPFQIIQLDPERNRTFFFWHVFVERLAPGAIYAWRADGPNNTKEKGYRFDREKDLVDPYARAVSMKLWDRAKAIAPGDNRGSSMRAIVVKEEYDWEGDRPLNHPSEKMIIYELHVSGFTRHSSARTAAPGTFAGLAEKIPYLLDLGVTDVELMPIMAFDEQDVPRSAALLNLTNYWGYSPHSFFSLHPSYCFSCGHREQLKEFRDMVKKFHRAGIGVILDVVFNHTAEAGEDGATINFRGLTNDIFYHLDPEDRRIYRDFTGCGNTINCNHPLVCSFLISCLEYWVRELHVDGFRFDLASVLSRGERGEPMYNAPVLWNIEFSNELSRSHVIAEAWDAGGLFQVGGFPGFRWAEWNGRYRDVIRKFVRGDRGLIGEVATRLSGSSDLYEHQGRLPINSINFVTCHDGFTLHDLVSYEKKHNEMNGEENRDGWDENLSWNCGVEGETEDREILSLRRKLAKNFMAVLLLSQGVPMILSGDEILRTQKGNNNAYCQDNEISWIDWTLLEKNREMLRFVRMMIGFRKRHPCLMRRHFFRGTRQEGGRVADVTWHGLRLNKPLWNDPDAQVLSFTLGGVHPDEEDLHVILNMSEGTFQMALPEVEGRYWTLAIDTSKPSPGDILAPGKQPVVRRKRIPVRGRSVVVLESRPG
ncbi:MAG: glycogen debranching enzyme GlgX [Deltaproteobacteria bacterium HGW-Deltaproteobacteria-21]|nr:MAG: glycogen debranching enzyme GlgX [Deltaproteobacteria bacterium HGW-Deltaproteobacteria-21]